MRKGGRSEWSKFPRPTLTLKGCCTASRTLDLVLAQYKAYFTNRGPLYENVGKILANRSCSALLSVAQV
jgi:hypothetical protein